VLAVTTTSTRALWYFTRGTGFVALLLLTASLVLGIMETVRWARPRWPKLLTAGLHRNVSLLVVLLLALHIAAAVIDGFAPIGWIAAVVPYSSPYRPLWLGLGALAVDLVIALVVTSLVRARLGLRTWRIVHWTAYACWPVALLHGLGTGTDTKLGWALVLNLGCLAAVVGAVWWRIAADPRGATQREGLRTLAAFASAAVAVGIVGFVALGPLRPGWSRRAGTPSVLISGTSSAAGRSAVSPSSLRPPFTATFAGQVAQSAAAADGSSTVTVTGNLSQGASGILRVVLTGPALSGGGVQMASSTATLGPTQQPRLFQGRIASLQGASMMLDLTDGHGTAMRLNLQLHLDGQGGATGTAQATASAG
jgi:sulfoxide reductase heme-binding subunit YedZ